MVFDDVALELLRDRERCGRHGDEATRDRRASRRAGRDGVWRGASGLIRAKAPVTAGRALAVDARLNRRRELAVE